MDLLNEKELKELNNIANVVISNEIRYPLDSDLLLYIFRKMSRESSIKKPREEIKVELSREKLLKYVLEFYRTIDVEYYKKARDYLLQLDKNKRLEIFYSKKDRLTKDEKKAIETHGSFNHSNISDYTQILIPLGLNETKEERKNNMINKATLNESFTTVHEIAHSLDLRKTMDFVSKTINIDETSYKRTLGEIEKSLNVRNAFCETTAITFESLYGEYLKGKVPLYGIKNRVAGRYNNCILNAEICYDNLSIADIKRKKGIIKNEDIEQLMKENKDTEKMIRQRIDRIFKHKGDIIEQKRYALAGLFVPTLVEKYKQQGAEVLKQYINSVKNNSVDDVFQSVQVSQNEDGYDKLFDNMKRNAEQFRDTKDKKRYEMTK